MEFYSLRSSKHRLRVDQGPLFAVWLQEIVWEVSVRSQAGLDNPDG